MAPREFSREFAEFKLIGALGEPTKAVGSIADEYDQGLWTFRLDYDDAGLVERVSVKAV